MVDFKKELKELRARKKLVEKYKLTFVEATAIKRLKGGCDVYDYELAGILRKMQRRGLPVDQLQGPAVYPLQKKKRHRRFKNALFIITDPMSAPKDGAARQPYFGAIATPHGIELANTVAGW